MLALLCSALLAFACFCLLLLSRSSVFCLFSRSGVQVVGRSGNRAQSGHFRRSFACRCVIILFLSLSCVFCHIRRTGKGTRGVFLPWVLLLLCLPRLGLVVLLYRYSGPRPFLLQVRSRLHASTLRRVRTMLHPVRARHPSRCSRVPSTLHDIVPALHLFDL